MLRVFSQGELSRASWTYRFVFGHEPGYIDGFKEPLNDVISSGYFVLLFFSMLLLKPLAYGMAAMMKIIGYPVGFLIDGSYMKGDLIAGAEFKKIEPWPCWRGKRISPYPFFILLLTVYLFWIGDVETAVIVLFGGIFVAVVSVYGPKGPTPAMQMAEHYGPKLDEAVFKRYYRKPKWFPPLQLVD